MSQAGEGATGIQKPDCGSWWLTWADSSAICRTDLLWFLLKVRSLWICLWEESNRDGLGSLAHGSFLANSAPTKSIRTMEVGVGVAVTQCTMRVQKKQMRLSAFNTHIITDLCFSN